MFCCFYFLGDPLGLCFGKRFEFILKATHAGNAGAAVADVVDDLVGTADDFAWCAVEVCVPGIRLDYPEHWLTPASARKQSLRHGVGFHQLHQYQAATHNHQPNKAYQRTTYLTTLRT